MDQHYEGRSGKVGTEECATCNRDGCPGTMLYPDVVNCSCHVWAPCGRCENNPLTCDTCGMEVE